MTIFLVLWGLASASEILIYQYQLATPVRRWWVILTGAMLLVSSTGLLLIRPTLWAPFWVIGLYRLVALARSFTDRLSAEERQRSSMRALAWLLLTQVTITGFIRVAMIHHIVARYSLDVFIAVQALVALVILRLSYNTWHRTAPKADVQSYPDKDLPSLSVLVPARNETTELEKCLTTLIASDYPKLEIIVLDDSSTERRTSEIIRSFAQSGVRFVPGSAPTKQGWLSKNWAYQRLAKEASGELLLFCGVDVNYSPRTLRLLVEQMLEKQKVMMSVLPLRDETARKHQTLLQPMRYFWELCLPRRFFRRPPVLSTCWLIRADALWQHGGFAAVARSITPEAHFARQAVIGDHYSFIRSDETIGLRSTKLAADQLATMVRTRYPQLHRRLELVMFTSLFELAFMLGPLIGVFCAWLILHSWLLGLVWLGIWLSFVGAFYLVSVRTHLLNPLIAWLLFPIAVLNDVVMLHVSCLQYEFGHVIWKGRDVSQAVMRVDPPKPL